jgi:hypothetical protein
MASVTSFYDPKVHRIYPLGSTLSAPGSAATVSLQGTTDARYPGGHYLEINLGGGAAPVRIPSTGIQPPSTGHVAISAPSGDQVPVSLDDNIHRTLVLGTELSSDPAHSVTIVNKRDPATNTVSDTLLYANAAGANATIPVGGKIPPKVG